MLQRVTDIYAELIKLNNELQDIRAKCKHETFKVEMFSWRLGSYYPSRMCDNCGLAIPGVTPEEEKTCWETFTGRSFEPSCGTEIFLGENKYGY